MSVSRFDISLVRVSPGNAAAAGVLSLGGLAFSTLEGWPAWARGLAAVVPLLPVFAQRVMAIFRIYQWLALFYALVVTQTAHFLEHVAQLVQIHVLGLSGAVARGIFGALDVEWVHFIWNTWVLLAVLMLLARFANDRWLWLTALLSAWHEVEHAYIFSVYLSTGLSGTPGLLSQGGALGGGFPVSRPDLHFVYNLIETAPLIIGFLAEVRRMPIRTIASAMPCPTAAERSVFTTPGARSGNGPTRLSSVRVWSCWLAKCGTPADDRGSRLHRP